MSRSETIPSIVSPSELMTITPIRSSRMRWITDMTGESGRIVTTRRPLDFRMLATFMGASARRRRDLAARGGRRDVMHELYRVDRAFSNKSAHRRSPFAREALDAQMRAHTLEFRARRSVALHPVPLSRRPPPGTRDHAALR